MDAGGYPSPSAAGPYASVSAPGASVALHRHEPGRGVADIRALVMAHRDEARACYDAALADHPGIEGDLLVRWTIDPKGRVSEAAVDNSRSQIVDPSVADCVARIVKRIQFAASPGGYETKASYPFNFHPHKSPRTNP